MAKYELQLESLGAGGATATHGGVWSPDKDGLMHSFKANEPVWEGMRVGEVLGDEQAGQTFDTGVDGFEDSPADALMTEWDSVGKRLKILFNSTSNRFTLLAANNLKGSTQYLVEMDVDTTEFDDPNITISVYVGGVLVLWENSTSTSQKDWIAAGVNKRLWGYVTTAATPPHLVKVANARDTTGTGGYIDNISIREVSTVYFADDGAGTLLDPQPWLRYQKAATNFIKQSRDYTTGWDKSGTLTYDAIGITGEPNTATRFTGAGGWAYQDVTITPVEGNKRLERVYIRKTFANETMHIEFGVQAATAVQEDVTLNCTTGDIVEDDAGGEFEVVSLGDWWVVYLLVVENATANTRLRRILWADFDGCIIGQVDSISGFTIQEAKQLGPIFTEGTAVSTSKTSYNWAAANHSDEGDSYQGDFRLTGESQVLLSMGGVPVLEVKDGGVGDELVTTDPVTASDYAPQGANTVTDDGDAVKETFVDTASGARLLLSTAGVCAVDMVPGETYVLQATAKKAGPSQPQLGWRGDGTFTYSERLTDDYKVYEWVFVAYSSAAYYYLFTGYYLAGNEVWIKDVTLKSAGKVHSLSDGTNECSVPVVSAEPHIKASYDAGGMTLDVDGVTDSSPYNGNLGDGDLGTECTLRKLQRIMS